MMVDAEVLARPQTRGPPGGGDSGFRDRAGPAAVAFEKAVSGADESTDVAAERPGHPIAIAGSLRRSRRAARLRTGAGRRARCRCTVSFMSVSYAHDVRIFSDAPRSGPPPAAAPRSQASDHRGKPAAGSPGPGACRKKVRR